MASPTPVVNPAKDDVIVATWPRRYNCVPRGSLSLKSASTFWMSLSTPPRSRPSTEAYTFIIAWLSYWLSRAGSVLTLIPTIFPRICGDLVIAEAIGILSSDCIESILYCGDCTATLYSYPLAGLTQNDGETVELELRVSRTLLETSCWVRPTDCTRVR